MENSDHPFWFGVGVGMLFVAIISIWFMPKQYNLVSRDVWRENLCRDFGEMSMAQFQEKAPVVCGYMNANR